MDKSANKKYFIGMQILRAFAFMGVFLIHVTWVQPVFACWSITVFLMLSGFLNVLHGYEKNISYDFKSSIKYGVKKVKNIYPLHLLMLFFAFLLYVFSFRSEIMVDFKEQVVILALRLLSNIFLLSDWGPKSGWFYNVFSEYNIVTWYLSLSLLLFILSPVLMAFMHRLYDRNDSKKKSINPWLVIFVTYVITVIVNMIFVATFGKSGSFLYTYECPLSRIGDYFIAMQMGYIYMQRDKVDDKDEATKWISVLAATSLISIFLISISASGLLGEENWISKTGFYFTIPVAGLIYATAKLEDRITENWIVKILATLGALSQYAYLIHVPIINLIHGVYKRVTDVNVIVWGLLSFVITMMLSVVTSKIKKKRTV
jgi:peptidoglycan/LPS O-acetylase OafA/YrhL